MTTERFQSFLVFLAHEKFTLAALKYSFKEFKHMDYVFVKIIARAIMREWRISTMTITTLQTSTDFQTCKGSAPAIPDGDVSDKPGDIAEAFCKATAREAAPANIVLPG